MKKLIFAGLFVVVAAISASAQKGSILVYGNVGAQTISNNGGSSFVLAPGVGYQLDEKWTVGGELGMSVAKGNTPSFKVGPFVRRTWPISNIFSVNAQLGLGYMSNGEAENFFTNEAVSDKGLYASLTVPNISINVKNGFALNFGAGQLYFTSTKPQGGGDNTSKFGFDFGRGVTFGISKNFGGKK